MRGISFRVFNESGNILSKIFDGFDIGKFTWYSSDVEIYDCNNESLFITELIDGDLFQTFLKNNMNYYVISIVLMAFDGEYSNVTNYKDFESSSCDLAVLVSDSIYVEVYCKRQEDIKKMNNNALKYNFSDIEYITDENDSRDVFSVR